ncbi:hypothetical protein BLOT_008490 [Blomia tropicalis]|nr:hypothetical protein BLOT_008490 [Blomia tropicalis]
MIILLGGLMSYTLRNEVRIAHLIINNSVPTQWIDQRMHRQLLSTIGRYGNHTKITDAWDTVQQKFECCGIEFNNQPGYTWYFHLNQAFKPPSRRRVPESCCRAPTNEPALQRCLLDPTNSTYTFHANCYIHMKAAMIDHARLVRSISISIIFIFIIAMIHSMILFYKLFDKDS